MRRFQASLGRKVMIITGLVVVILVVVSISSVVVRNDMNQVAQLALIILPFSALGIGLLFRVWSYDVYADHIRIRRMAFPVNVPIDSLKTVEQSPEMMSHSVRNFGNGGLFGFYGRFWEPGFGKFHAYVTNPENTVRMTVENKNVALSPDQPEDFVLLLRERMDSAASPAS